ncbi:MAG: ATP-binding cassette domain-containing protein [Anaerolineales bacterium]|nr:ATP-binding cassette domain-containing protein [Anaerolineales bacterium]
MAPILELEGITKRFPGVLANDQITFSLEEGEIHGILGENGAGKTTLMNILYGLYHPDEGEIRIRGESVEIVSTRDAIQAGIGMVHQHFMLIPVFTVTENVMLGDEPTRLGGVLDRDSTAERIRDISSSYGLEIDPNAYVSTLPVGVQQRVEIIKLLYREADILIFDEPTSVLTPQEADQLFHIMRSLVESGKSIIFISHKLREVLDISDRITVIRQGKVVGTTTPQEADKSTLAAMMVGREVVLEVEKSEAKPTDLTLRVENLGVLDDRDTLVVNGVSFDVYAGEILGIAGVQGNGQTQLVEALTGLRHPVDGRIELLGTDITHASPREITELGTAHIPEDRQRDGLVLPYPVMDNMVLNTYYRKPFSERAVLRDEAIQSNAEALIEDFDIRTPSAMVVVSTLSGGNQQKVIVARELSRPIKLLVASQPTRGLDVGSIEYIHSRLVEKRDEGVAVLLISTELDEIMQLSDRIAVMFQGQIIEILAIEEASKEKLGLLMAGILSEDQGV